MRQPNETYSRLFFSCQLCRLDQYLQLSYKMNADCVSNKPPPLGEPEDNASSMAPRLSRQPVTKATGCLCDCVRDRPSIVPFLPLKRRHTSPHTTSALPSPLTGACSVRWWWWWWWWWGGRLCPPERPGHTHTCSGGQRVCSALKD